MNPALPELAIEFGASAERAFAHLGAVDCARRAEADPSLRAAEAGGAIKGLGAGDLDPRADLDVAAAAGELCRVAGRVALPYPVVAYLMRDPDDRPLALVGSERLRADHGDLFDEWRVASISGWAKTAAAAGPPLASKLGPFVTDLSGLGDTEPSTTKDLALHLTLTAWRILGSAERGVELAVAHVRDRVQFGQALAEFQAVQFQLADASVAVDGLRELCRFTLWRLGQDPGQAITDALALRLHALDVARASLRICQQLHGAAGLCDEYDISILIRHIQPDLRLPFGAETAAADLFDAVMDYGFDSLFPHGGRLR